MSSARSRRAWVPGAVASIVMVAELLGAWAFHKSSVGGDDGPKSTTASLAVWLRDANDQFFGISPFASSGNALAGTVTAIVLIVLVGVLLTWWALSGLRPGSALRPAFLATWMALVVASVVAAFVRWVVIAGSVNFPGSGQVGHAVLSDGVVYGAKYGWLAALVGIAVWARVRDDAGADPDPEPFDEEDDPDKPREFVMKRRADFNLEDRATAERNAETFGRRESDRPRIDLDPSLEPDLSPGPDDDARTTELPADPFAPPAETTPDPAYEPSYTSYEAPADPYEPRTDPRPASLLGGAYDVTPAEPEPEDDRPAGEARTFEVAAPVYESPVYEAPVYEAPTYEDSPEPAEPTYVGRRSSGRYAEDEDPAPGSDGGSHRI